ncbi:adenosylhomocysteinase [Salinadaptatus halalkaliphilus]|uniref:Adenosylhomocysteinase n=1 Tax=Salinadaptatus halalkaliphilus TaxID=2419781 RepID=A0A4S3TIV3_9EURY|nr:adenosylhomocysteinase [Salinadaptatus halalkaliphilus]THE63969.1 adenosylhomocysteinase [Salinadaptatus halalkaliphilus]
MADETDVSDPLGWTRDHTPLLRSYQREYGETTPLEGYSIGVATHMEAKSGVFVETLAEAGAEVLFTGSEPHSTKGEVVEYLDEQDGIESYVEAGMSEEAWVDAQHALLEEEPDFILDDGAELIARVHADHPEIAQTIVGGGEQTTAGITRLEAMEDQDVLEFPVYSVNDTPMKHFFDNVHGTAESSLTNALMTTNTMLSGKTVVVAGYGYCGRGIARKARGMGAKTVVTEVDPRKALEAHMDGHRIASMDEATPEGDYFITSTGNREVLRREHFEQMQDGAILANAGHFDVEIAIPHLEDLAENESTPTEGVTRYHLPDGRQLDLLADGRLVNLTGPYSKGHPAEVMDMTFAMMVMAADDMLTEDRDLAPGVYAIPDRVDRTVADRKLETLDCSIDDLTENQEEYYDDWEHPDSHF